MANEKNLKPFKKGFDERRWMQGAKPRVPRDVKALMDNLLWDIAAEELTVPATGEVVDRLRVMLRSMTTSRHSADKKEFLDRLAGKVTEKVDVNQNGQVKVIVEYTDGNPTKTT